jgi:hypothetical protein
MAAELFEGWRYNDALGVLLGKETFSCSDGTHAVISPPRPKCAYVLE